ncbi:MAG: protein translocase subunit SecF, partial [Acetobacter orientalis]
MFGRPLLRFVRKDTHINFMRGRFAGLITSAVLSLASLGLFFYPGLTLGLDFRGGIVVEA